MRRQQSRMAVDNTGKLICFILTLPTEYYGFIIRENRKNYQDKKVLLRERKKQV